MHKPSLVLGALLGGITSLPLMALLFMAEQFAGLPFVPFDLFDWLARVLPGNVITIGIDFIVKTIRILNLGPTSNTAKLIEQLMALALGLAGGMVLGLVIAWLLSRTPWPAWAVGAGIGFLAFLLVAAIELNLGILANPVQGLIWLALVISGWGALLGHLLGGQSTVVTDEAHAARRAVLLKIAGGSAAVALGAWGLGSLLGTSKTATGAGQPLAKLMTPTPGATSMPDVSPTAVRAMASPSVSTTAVPSPTLGASPTPGASATASATSTPLPAVTATATMRDRLEPAPGTRLELTPNKDFYRIDINTRPLDIDGKSWVLAVAGLFDRPRPLTLADLMAYPPITQAITQSCISNPIGGDLIGTTNYTGVRLRDLLKDLGLQSEAKELFIEASDGFYESVVMEDLMDPRTLLVYGMNGETLPAEHGFPLRIYIPDRYGMKQPKWIIRITAVDHKGQGYWVDRGWSAEAHPQIISVIDTAAKDNPVEDRIPIGGIAWAGERGIRKVEVRVDEGEWVEATLRTPPLSPLTWVQWRYDWPGHPGQHTFTVRATDGAGALQIEKSQDVRPDGATGYHSVSARI